MKKADALGISLEAASAKQQRFTWAEQVQRSGEIAKATSIARCLPKAGVRMLLKAFRKDTLPVQGGFKEREVLATGGEVTVYQPKRGNGNMVKLFHPNKSVEAHLERHQHETATMRECFGDLVVPAAYFVYQSQHRSDQPRLGVVQEPIEGSSLFDDLSRAKQADIDVFYNGIVHMAETYGQVPDLDGDKNYLVDSTGAIRIVDCGLTEMSEAEQTPAIMANLAQLQTLATRKTQPVNPAA